MKNIKKITAIAAAVMMCMSISGCSSGETYKADGGGYTMAPSNYGGDSGGADITKRSR